MPNSTSSPLFDLIAFASTRMENSSTSLAPLPTTLHSTPWTTMISSTLKASIATSAFPTSVITDLSSIPSSTLSPSTLTSSLTTLLVTHATTLISAATPNTTLDGETTSNKSSSSAALSEEERSLYLDRLQEKTTQNMIPTVIFLAIIAVVGLIGNSMVLLVYSKKAQRNATDIFIMAIAAFDLFTNALAIPGEIYDTFHYWDFDMPTLCKFRLYFNAIATLTSALALLAVAYSRYRKVCRPFGKQTSLRTAKWITGIIALACCVFAVPQAILYGIQTRPTPRPNVFGQECSTDDKYVDTIWPLIYNGFFMVLFLSVCIPLIVFYVLIGVQAWRHSKIHGIPIIQKTPTTSDQTTSDTLDSTDDTDRKSKAWSFFRKKNKYDITPGDSSNDERTNEIKSKPTSDHEKKDEKMSTSDQDAYCTKMMRSPTKDKSHVNIPMIRELSVKLNRIRDSVINTDKDNDTDEEDEQLKPDASKEMSPPLKCSEDLGKPQVTKEDAENSQNENSTTGQMSDFAASMQWVDITYCLNEERKMEEQDEAPDDGTCRKKSAQSARVSRQNSLRQKLSDTLTKARKPKKESIALSEVDRSANAVSASASDGACGNNHIKFHETVTETNGDIRVRKGLKSCETSPRNSPRNGTLKSKSDKSKSNPHRRVLTRTTLMLIIISAVYVIAFVPHLVLMTCKFLVPNFLGNMSDAEYATYNIFLRFYFVNSAANAIIYSLCDVRFRGQVQKIMRCKN